MSKLFAHACIWALTLGLSAAVWADDLTRMAQENLVTLGYDVGPADGQAGTKTIIAISRFQAERGMEVTGEVSPQLVGTLKAAVKQQGQPGKVAQSTGSPTAPTSTTSDQASLDASRQACLQQKMEAAEKNKKTKRAFMRILNTVTRTSSQYGDGELARTISTASGQAYNANASYEDIKGAAKDLGLTESDIEDCRTP